MPFAWFSDDFYDHPKVRALPRRYRNEAAGLFVRLVTLSNRHLTDGVITEADIEVCDGNKRLVDLLLEVPHGFKVGLLEHRRGKLRIHDFHQFSKTKRQVVSERKKKAEAGRKGGIESGKRRRSKPRSKPEAPASPVVEPRTPSPSDTESSSGSFDPREPRLEPEQLAAWKDFTDQSWQPFKAAWLGKGLLLPPSGRADEPGSQRALLWEVAEAYPEELGRWVRESRARDSRVVIDDVLEQYHEARRKAARRADAQEAESARHKGPTAKAEAAAGMQRISDILPVGGVG